MLDELLRDLQQIADQSRSECVREAFSRYLYGTHGSPREHQGAAVRLSKRGAWGGRVQNLGKNVVDVKLWLSSAMRDDLAHLAERAGVTLSHFAREVVITHLLGNVYLPQRAALFVPRSEPDCASQQE